jgi:hypothetical protein
MTSSCFGLDALGTDGDAVAAGEGMGGAALKLTPVEL